MPIDARMARQPVRVAASYSRCACRKTPGSECNAVSGEGRDDIELRVAK
jgi:hypothetical protein